MTRTAVYLIKAMFTSLQHYWKRWNWLVLSFFHCFLLIITSVAIGLAFIHISGLPFRIGADEFELRNYSAVMRYLSPFSTAEFTLPDLPFSKNGAHHFYDCKVLFNKLYGFTSCVGLPVCGFIQINRKRCTRRFWITSGISACTVITILSFPFLLDFNSSFIFMHRFLFNNGYWSFNAYTDPIILLLPRSFFIQCSFIMLSFTTLFVALSFFNAYYLRKNQALHKNK